MPSINNNTVGRSQSEETRGKSTSPFPPPPNLQESTSAQKALIWHNPASIYAKTPFFSSTFFFFFFFLNIRLSRYFSGVIARSSPTKLTDSQWLCLCTLSPPSICSGGCGLLVNTNRIPSARTPSGALMHPFQWCNGEQSFYVFVRPLRWRDHVRYSLLCQQLSWQRYCRRRLSSPNHSRVFSKFRHFLLWEQTVCHTSKDSTSKTCVYQ